jgi:valyl-tRNA synthetase
LIKGAFDDETKAVAAWAFDQILVMLHPLMPFITEELWSANERPYELIVANWPEPEAQVDVGSRNELLWLTSLVEEIRAVRSEMGVPPAARTDLWISAESGFLAGGVATTSRQHLFEGFLRNRLALHRMARINSVHFLYLDEELDLATGTLRTVSGGADVKGTLSIGIDDVSYLLPLKDVIDLEAEKARLSKGAETAEKDRDSLAQRLANPNFTERAKPDAVEKARADHDAKAAEAERLRAALERLG